MRSANIVAVIAALGAPLVHGAPAQNELALQGGKVHTTESWAWSNCGLPTDPVQIDSIGVFPDPPQPGKNLTVQISGSIAERVEEGAYADVTVKIGLIKLLQKQFDICEEARNNNATVQCPVEKGKYFIQQTVDLPREIPPAKFTVNVRGYTADDDDLLCADLKVDFMKKPSLKPLGY